MKKIVDYFALPWNKPWRALQLLLIGVLAFGWLTTYAMLKAEREKGFKTFVDYAKGQVRYNELWFKYLALEMRYVQLLGLSGIDIPNDGFTTLPK